MTHSPAVVQAVSLVILVLASLSPAMGQTTTTPLTSPQEIARQLPCQAHFFEVEGHPAFLLMPNKSSDLPAVPWVWYAPTFPGHPDPSHLWMFRQFLEHGMAVAGVDVGESYGSRAGREIFAALYEKLRREYSLAERACLMPQSRGGLMLYNWAAENPGRVACIAGIYTVCDPRSYPGLSKACGAFGMSEATLAAHLAEHNPLERLRPLAEAGVPILHVHGDNDAIVPLDKNSAELASRYQALGGPIRLIVVPGKGHQVDPEFFERQELVDFVIDNGRRAIQMPAGDIRLIEGGHSSYRIVTPAKASPAVEHAAHELQSLLNRMTGTELPIVPEPQAGDAPAIFIGPCEKSQKAGLLDEASKLCEDGVLLRAIGNDIALLGRDERGNVYSVYVFLEKYLGVRFLAWDCTYVPTRRDVTLPRLAYSYSPTFMYRETLYLDSFPKEIASRQRLNGPSTKCDASVGGKIDFFPYVHSFSSLIPEQEFFKDHPEYFGLQGGKRVAGAIHAQLCLTNPDVLRIAKERVLKWIADHPEVPIFDVSQNDGNGACECEQCMAVVKEEGSQHGPILRFVNAIAEEVARKYPDKWIETLAYAYSVAPPAKTKPRDNVIIRLCHAGCFFHGFEQCKLGSDLTGWLDQWRQLTPHIFVWHYATNFAHYLAPNHNLNGLAADIRYYASHGVSGLMVQCDYQGHGGELAELRQYLAAQLMWDPTQDPMRIRREFCRYYYGPAADVALEFLGRLDELARQPLHAFAAWDPQATVPPASVSDALATLQRAYAAADTPELKNRVEKLMLPYWYMKLRYPEKYELSKAEGTTLVTQVKRVLDANKIEFISEGAANARQWIAATEAKYATTQPNSAASQTSR